MVKEPNFLPFLLNTMKQVHTEADLERFQAYLRKGKRFWIFFTVLLPLGAVILSLNKVGDHFQNHDWLGITSDILGSIAILALLFTLPVTLKKLQRGLQKISSSLPEKVLELRGQLHNETLVPSVAEQPLPLEAEELPFAPMRIRPIIVVRRVQSISFFSIVSGILLLLFDILLGVVIAFLFPQMQEPNSTTLSFWIVVALSLLLLIFTFFTITLFILAFRMLRADAIIVDEWGLRWKWPNLTKGISIEMAWPEITGFYVVANRGSTSNPTKTYVLDSANSTFTWFIRDDGTEKEQQASFYLTRLIVTRTGLPLRDLTNAFETLRLLFLEAKEAIR